MPLGELAALCGAELRRADPSLLIDGVASLDAAKAGELTFYTNRAYRRLLKDCQAAVIIAGPADAELPELAERPLLVANTPYAAFARLSAAFHPRPALPAGIDPLSRIDAGAAVDPTARIEAFVFVGAGARIGPRATLMAGAYVGSHAVIGADTLLYPHAVVRDGCLVGERCILHPGAVIGADGFGFAFDPEGDGDGPIHRKIPQAGIVRLEDDVEVGANSCVDRATLGETVIGRGTKLDNLVQIAHNVQVGPLCVFAAQVGIAGSATVGTGVALGGQAGVVGHVQIGDMVRAGAKAALLQDIEAGQTVAGHPAVEQKLWLRAMAALTRLPELLREVRGLSRRLTAIEDQLPSRKQ
jgi:UDP-3-O-[3-hydroxymyristoyl] glucosamine N-acyltransferase